MFFQVKHYAIKTDICGYYYQHLQHWNTVSKKKKKKKIAQHVFKKINYKKQNKTKKLTIFNFWNKTIAGAVT